MSVDLLIHISFLFIFCLVLAALETQIEAGSGWAKNLPTWRPSSSKWYARAYGKVMSGKELTGYHVLIFGLVFLFLHCPYFTGNTWSWPAELTTLSFFFIVIVIWDFLWFVINPHYDFMDFWHRRVLWHKKWFLHLPVDYWFAFAISGILYLRFIPDVSALKEWLLVWAAFISLTLVATVVADLAGVFILRSGTRKKEKI